MSAAERQVLADSESLNRPAAAWLGPATTPVLGRGLFVLALRAASLAWHPEVPVAPLPIRTDPAMALPYVLEAWRATERELAGLTGDSPEQEYLEANATMLQAMYQRLFVERMRR